MESPQITPEPTEPERAAILAALAAEEAEQREPSQWAEALGPARGGEENQP